MPVSLTILTLRPIRAFLSMMARSIDRTGPDADAGSSQPLVFLDLGGLLVEVDTHQVRVADRAFSPMIDRTPMTEFSITDPLPMMQPSQIRLFLTVAPLIREQGR